MVREDHVMRAAPAAPPGDLESSGGPQASRAGAINLRPYRQRHTGEVQVQHWGR